MSIELLIEPREKDIGGFSVRRVLPYAKRRMVGPWVFFDHMGPTDFPPGKGIDVLPHPHINLATVTYLFEGEILHRDSLGSLQPIRPGDINLMVAGSGITHSERETPDTRAKAHRLHGLQLWHALPVDKEEIAPAFYHYPAADIPSVRVDGVAVRVMIGSAYGVTSPVISFSNTLYAEAHLQSGQTLDLPDAEERALYVAEGEVKIGDLTIHRYCMAIVSKGAKIELVATVSTKIAIIGGKPLGARHIYWNFVSSRSARIEQAKQDWQAGHFPKVLGDDKEWIPLP